MTSQGTAEIVNKLPSLDEDPKERKRILGILAQRRYRQRKKQRRGQSQHPETRPFAGLPSSEELSPINQVQDDLNLDDNTGNDLSWAAAPAIVDDIFEFEASSESCSFSWPSEVYPASEQGVTHHSAQSTRTPSTSQLSWNDISPLTDPAYVAMPCLDLVRAKVEILTTILMALEIAPPQSGTIWNPFAISPFHASPNVGLIADDKLLAIPENYRPTSTQLQMVHHPIFDVFPWPSVRDKMLGIMALPLDYRPPRAKDEAENVVMQIKFDLFDPAGGTKIHGTDPMNGDSWEVGQVFFENWWWALDRSIINRSNEFRRARGEADLKHRRPE